MPSIIEQELVQIWKQLLRGVPQDIWYIIDDSEEFLPSLQMAISLNALEYETLLLSSGITFKRGDITMFSKAKLDYLQTALKENITLHITRSQLQRKGKHAYYLAVGHPLSNPTVIIPIPATGPFGTSWDVSSGTFAVVLLIVSSECLVHDRSTLSNLFTISITVVCNARVK